MRVQSGQEVDEKRIAVEVDLDEAPGFGQILVLIAAFPEPDNALKRIETINSLYNKFLTFFMFAMFSRWFFLMRIPNCLNTITVFLLEPRRS